jgi:IclR family transcriptional regulator, pca regulon regulatory protein
MRKDVQKINQRSNIWDTPQASSDPGISQSLERGLAILSVFTHDRAALGVSELARELSLTRSTTHRYVATLARLGYLQQDNLTRKYRLGPRVLDLGFSMLGVADISEIGSRLRHGRAAGPGTDPGR